MGSGIETEGGQEKTGRLITVTVRLDKRTFRRFAVFDALRVRRMGRRPLVFALLMLAFAAAALLLRREQSGMIAAVLLVVGVGLPLVWAGSFLSQINLQAEKNKLTPPRLVYTVTLSEEGVCVQNVQREEETLRLGWSEVWRAWRRRDCIYLYVTERRAFLLPSGQADAPDDEVWALCSSHLQGRSESGPRQPSPSRGK